MAHLVLDATGLKVYGEGEWKVHKHGKEKRRTWRKLHLGVDTASQHILCAELSLEQVHDSQLLPILLRPLRRAVKQVSADGAFDTRQCYDEIERKRAIATVPPRRNARLWEAEHPRNEAVDAQRAGQLAAWKHTSGYHQRSLAETAMWRYKALTGSTLRMRDYDNQHTEAMARVAVVNKMTRLGMPVSRMVA